ARLCQRLELQDAAAPGLRPCRGGGAPARIHRVEVRPATGPHEHEILAPAGMDRKAFDAGDLHRAMLSLVIAGPDPAIHRMDARDRRQIYPVCASLTAFPRMTKAGQDGRSPLMVTRRPERVCG